MLLIISIILTALLVGLVSGVLLLMIQGGKFSEGISKCSKCGGMNSVSADPPNSRLIIECKANDCDSHSFLSVRSSALSLFGVAQLSLIIILGILGFAFARTLAYGPMGKAFIIFICILAGGIVVRFFVRLIAFSILRSNPAPIWQKEIVAYLAPILPPKSDL